MAIVQISRITNRKGLEVDLPAPLAGAELGPGGGNLLDPGLQFLEARPEVLPRLVAVLVVRADVGPADGRKLGEIGRAHV